MAAVPPAAPSTYREVERLAEGGMAIVFRAIGPDGDEVVVKRVRPPLEVDAAYRRLFEAEGDLHAALRHENIVRLVDRGEDADGPFLVLEHVAGTDLGIVLERAIADERGLEPEIVLAIARPLFAALAAAHEATDEAGAPLGVVHRDVSPPNILLGDDGRVKLADFGVAASALKTEATTAGELKGKFAYMAPEQTRGERVTPAADLFAAGVVLWESLAGRRLFDGPTDADIVQSVRHGEVPSLDAVRPGLPRALVALVDQLLAKDPTARPASARGAAASIDALILSLGLEDGLSRHVARIARTTPRPAHVEPERRRTHRVVNVQHGGAREPTRRRVGWASAAAAVAVAAVVIGGALRFASLSAPAPVEAIPLPPSSPAPTPPQAAWPAPTLPGPDAPAPPVEPRATPRDIAPPPSAEPSTPTRRGATPPTSSGERRPPEPGFLSITATPWASVTIDGVRVKDETPLLRHPVAAGRHVIELENPVYGRKRRVIVDVPAGGEVKRTFSLDPDGPR